MRTRSLVALLLAAAAIVALADTRTSYVFKRGNQSHMRANGTIDEAVRVAKKNSGDFIWVRQDGREYMIRDAAVLAEASAAFRDLDEFEPTVRAAERKLRPYEDQMEELERRMDEISDSFDDEDLSVRTQRDLEAKLREVEKQVRGIEDVTRELERELERFEEQMDRRGEEAERKLESIIRRAIRSGAGKRIEN